MVLTPGSRLGVYEIAAPIGEGGMGQVWRATDTSLGRQVAIKILPDEFAADPERLARFEREARTLASLNHPHIAQIYGLEVGPAEAGRHTGTDVASGFSRTRALVMELVEGEDLSQRIARGAIPLDEALPLARQIAEALEAAHEQGIIHRDLKPANIRVRPDGTVKVLDFGLAKAMDASTGPKTQAPGLPDSPTITSPAMTMRGMILGTAAYMAPEQAKGKLLDRRADVWAFGAVLFEMLTGQRAFKGEDITDTIVAVVSKEPDWSALPANTPPAIRKLLRRCLERDRKRRLADAADARLEIDEALTAPSTVEGAVAASAPSPSGGRMAWMVAAAALVGMAALAVPTLRHLNEAAPSPPAETRLDIVTPSTDRPGDFALSPDGRHIVFVASADGVPRLWLRSLESATAQPLTGTDAAFGPFWSPDSRSIGFFAGNALKRLDLGGTVQTLAPATNGSGGTWNADGVIVFAPSLTGPLMRVSATGGAVSVVTETVQQSHTQPFFLPDGHRFLFQSTGVTAEITGVYLGSLDRDPPIRLAPADRGGLYLPAVTLSGTGTRPAAASSEGGWLLWVRAGTQTLAAQPFDVAHGALTGDPVTLADAVGAASVSASGLVAYRSGDNFQPAQLTWVDRSGARLGTVGDARWVAYQSNESGQNEIYVRPFVPPSLGASADQPEGQWQVSTGGGIMPAWRPDGREFYDLNPACAMMAAPITIIQKLAAR